ncbi:MAG: hypothetical protein ACE5HX_03030 [bacterium]
MRLQKIHKIIIVILLINLGWLSKLLAQGEVIIDQAKIATATVTNPKLIDFFIQSYLIPETEVTEIQFIDATGNGFGEEDLIKCFPSEKTYYLFPSDTAQKVMNKWKYKANYQITVKNESPEVFESLETRKAENWILSGLLRSLNWNYSDLPMKIYFARDSTTMVFEMWGYNPWALQWKPPAPPPKVPETTYDVVHIIRSDTLFVADTTYYDQFYIYRSVSDTLFISEKELSTAARPLGPAFEPGLVPSSAIQRRE